LQSAIAVKSKKGGVKYRLEAGPKGMSVAADGKVTWKAPAEGGTEDVILSVSDATGQEIFHTFKVFVATDGAAPPPRPAPPDRLEAAPMPQPAVSCPRRTRSAVRDQGVSDQRRA
jgi:hypothetical protein